MSGEPVILRAADGVDRARLGGKAAALAELHDAGFVVPPWFVVPPTAARLETAPLARALDDALQELGHRGTFAVRSSAVDEDGAGHSFAGQFESYLGVRAADVVGRVRDVWRSAESRRVAAYRAEHGLAGPGGPPAVLVQAMIEPAFAGVAFSADPVTGSRSTALVSTVAGLGTVLVGGDVDAHEYAINRDGAILRHRAGRQERIEQVVDGRVQQAPIDGVTPPPDDLVRDVAALARRCARHFGRPQDIEWAWAGGTLYLLQSRPVTTLGRMPDPDGLRMLWDSSNIAESYGGVTSPLTFSFARTAYEGVYRRFCQLLRVPRRSMEANDFIFARMLGFIRGRVYYNLLNWYRLLAMLPGFRTNRAFMEQMMGVREALPEAVVAEIATVSGSSAVRDRLDFVRMVVGVVVSGFMLPRAQRRFARRLEAALAPPAVPLETMRIDELVRSYRDLESRLLHHWDAPIVNDFFAMLFFGVLRRLCERWVREPGLHNALVSGDRNVISAEPAKRVSAMAAAIRDDAVLVDALCEGPVDPAMAHLRAHPVAGPLLGAYLDRFADRCLEELKLESATLADDPAPLVRAIGHAARRAASQVAGSSPESAAAGAVPAPSPRDMAERTARAALRRRPVRRLLFAWVLRTARARVRDRENLRFERTRVFGRVRRIVVEMGRRLHGEGVLEAPADVFMLELDEICGFVDGTGTVRDLAALVRLRRAADASDRDGTPPADRFETSGAVWIGNRFAQVTPPPADDPGASGTDGHAASAAVLRHGLGCCPGIVRGPVRVIRDPRGVALHAGEILVAERTDPGWILLFPAASGLIVERGSLLSHSAIVARELGLPAVVSVPGVTQWLRDGDIVEFDGALGSVRLIDRTSSA